MDSVEARRRRSEDGSSRAENETEVVDQSGEEAWYFQEFKPYDRLIYECSQVINDLCTSVWYYNLPTYSNLPQKTVVRFRAKERTQEVPFVTLAAFKHHVQNITRLGKVIFVLRKCLQWIENQEDEIHSLSSIFLWKTGLLEFADEVRAQISSVRVCRRVIEKLGSITRRLPTANQDPAFEVRALVTIKNTPVGWSLEANKRYTVTNSRDRLVWRVKELNAFVPAIYLEAPASTLEDKLCRTVEKQLATFKDLALTIIRQEMLAKLEEFSRCSRRQGLRQTLMDYFTRSTPQVTVSRPTPSSSTPAPPTSVLKTPLSQSQSVRVPRTQLYYPRHTASLRIRSKSSAPSTALPLELKEDLEHWLREYPGNLDCSAVDKFTKWMQETPGLESTSIEEINTGLLFIRILEMAQEENLENELEESGFAESCETPTFKIHNFVNSSFRWNAKIETISEVQKDFEWEGNVPKANELTVNQTARSAAPCRSMPGSKQYVWNIIRPKK
ncbi:hypothetical protein AAHC03_019252 [Spirometra sp. Aus1]